MARINEAGQYNEGLMKQVNINDDINDNDDDDVLFCSMVGQYKSGSVFFCRSNFWKFLYNMMMLRRFFV